MQRRWQGMPALALVAAGALLLAGLVMAIITDRDLRAQQAQAAIVVAETIAASVTAALTFDDAEAAQEYLDALRANPEILAAAVYRQDGTPMASYARDGQTVPREPPPFGQSLGESRLSLGIPVTLDGTRVGAVFLRSLTQTRWQRLARYSAVGVLILMAALVVLVQAASQLALSRANKELAQRAEALARANEELQAQMQEREKAETALRQAQKMETVGQLTGGVAHDFNNLLTIILGNVERLQRRLADGSDKEVIARAAGNIQAGAERAAALTRSLLAFSRRQPLDPKPVDVNKLVADMSALLRRTLSEQVAIETVGAGGLWRTLVDPNQLENAIINLAVNARDAMPGGGRLTIETANAYLDDRYAAEQENLSPGQYVVLSLTDTGIGMTKEVAEQAFDPFYTTKDVGHGTGLGLSQVYGFVKQSGGNVKLYSEPGQGTTVKIYLPRLPAGQEVEAAPEVAVVTEVSGGDASEVVLVVEDEDSVRAHSVDMLGELGYRVYEASTGAAALQVLAQHPEISLLFTDVGLPGGMNGRQLADAACAGRPDLAVLFTTGYARNAIVHDGRLDPGVRLIPKPFTYAQLAKALRSIFDKRATAPCILLVEDEMMIRMNTAETLEELGFRCVEAGTGAEAMAALRRLPEGIDAAVVDLGLPDRAGDSLIREMRAVQPRLPVVIASGATGDVIAERFGGDPLMHCLAKPYDGDGLSRALYAVGVRAKSDAG